MEAKDTKRLKSIMNYVKKLAYNLVGENHKFKFSHSIPANKDTVNDKKVCLSDKNFIILAIYPESYENEVENIVSQFNELAK